MASLFFASCAAGVDDSGIISVMNPALGDGGIALTGGTGGTAGTGGLTGATGGLTGGGFTGGLPPATGGGLAGTGGLAGAAGGTAGVGAGLPAGARNPTKLPTASGACPEFGVGDVMVSPAGEAQPRKVFVWSGQGGGGPLVIYWHSTSAQPSEAAVALSGVIEQITAAGGVVAAPYPGANEGMYPWVNTMPVAYKVADEIVACAIAKKAINPARIHTIGYSAGGLMASSLAVQRSSYVASVTAYSGGQTATARAMFEDPTNKLSALLFHGGPSDMAGGTSYPTAATNYAMSVKGNGGTAVICNHTLGRSMPPEGPAAAWRFFQDHPYGRPSPYAAGLPAGAYPMYCMLQL